VLPELAMQSHHIATDQADETSEELVEVARLRIMQMNQPDELVAQGGDQQQRVGLRGEFLMRKQLQPLMDRVNVPPDVDLWHLASMMPLGAYA
jgi:ABC-type arginine transport system ATPase subunit